MPSKQQIELKKNQALVLIEEADQLVSQLEALAKRAEVIRNDARNKIERDSFYRLVSDDDKMMARWDKIAYHLTNLGYDEHLSIAKRLVQAMDEGDFDRVDESA